MKTFVIATVAAMMLATTAQANVWTWMKNNNLNPKEPSAAYRVPTEGLDVRVYEWSPVGNPDVVCVMAFGQTHPVGMQCVEKTEKENN